jgi:5-methylcytosine-specific restriction endonuclease McrA
MWKNGDITGIGCEKYLTIKPSIRRYLLECADNKCSKCGWGTVHPSTGRIPLQINHIDGNAANSSPNNLEVVCPNCHSLTSNFGSLNKNSARKYRYNTDQSN